MDWLSQSWSSVTEYASGLWKDAEQAEAVARASLDALVDGYIDSQVETLQWGVQKVTGAASKATEAAVGAALKNPVGSVGLLAGLGVAAFVVLKVLR